MREPPIRVIKGSQIQAGDTIIVKMEDGWSYAEIDSIGEEKEKTDEHGEYGVTVLFGRFWGPTNKMGGIHLLRNSQR